MRLTATFDNKVKQKNDMSKQNISESYQTVDLKPKRVINKVVDRLNSQGLKSLNGKEYNYMKVWQVINGRWDDINVSIAHQEVLIEEQKKVERLQQLSRLN